MRAGSDGPQKLDMEDPQELPQAFKFRLKAARLLVSAARASGSKPALAHALKELGNLERRVPHLRDDANRTYAEAADLYSELEMPLEAAWVIRHIGINLEYAELLSEAEARYDESLQLFRQHATANTLNYANTARYPAVIKNRLGKREESRELWEEVMRRYDEIGAPVGVAEAAAWLTIFAIDKGDPSLAAKWFERAESASASARDADTDVFIAEVRKKLSAADAPTDGDPEICKWA